MGCGSLSFGMVGNEAPLIMTRLGWLVPLQTAVLRIRTTAHVSSTKTRWQYKHSTSTHPHPVGFLGIARELDGLPRDPIDSSEHLESPS